MTDGVFSGEKSPESYVETLVGEGKKYADLETLAKSRVDADNYIEQLKTEAAELRGELEKRETAAEIADRIRQQTANQANREEAKPASEPKAPEVDTDELVERVLKAQDQRTKQGQKQSNLESVGNKMIEVYGTTQAAHAALKARAEELGTTVERMQELASDSPKAFFDLVRIDQQAPKQAPAPRSDVNSGALQHTGGQPKEGTNAYYEKLRAEIGPTAFYSPKIQNQRMKDAIRLGDAFFQ